MHQTGNDILNLLKPRKLLLPILIGLTAVSILLYKNFDAHAFDNIRWTWASTWWMMLAFFMVFLRDFAYMIRLKVLTDNKLSWKQTFEAIMCWEFASAVAPGAIGGGFAFAIFIINKEGIKLGKSAAIVLFSSFLDGLFFLIMAPLVYFLIGKTGLFENVIPESLQVIKSSNALHTSFWIIYCVVIFYKVVVGYALFVDAKAVKKLLMLAFSLKFLSRWKDAAEETGNELIDASKELKSRKLGYWIYSFIPTFVSWSARFAIINCIIAAFSTIDLHHLVCFGRQVVIGVLMMGTPTPGGSGLAEIGFQNFLGEFIDNAALTVSLAFLWRLISYYPYLLMGVVVIPKWIRRVYSNKEI